MEIKTIIFYLLGIWILSTAVLAVTSRQIFRSAIYLLFCMMGVAGFYFWMNYEFIAAVQIIVYVGGIVVLIIFSIFLTHQAGNDMPLPGRRRKVFTSLAIAIAFILFWIVIQGAEFTEPEPGGELSVKRIGEEMLKYHEGGYVLPFEVVSLLLLSAMIGCIVIAMRATPEESKA